MSGIDWNKYVTELSGSYFSYRHSSYPPSSTPPKDGRFHHFDTGSIYFGESEATCAAETSGSAEFSKYKLFSCDLSTARVVDLVSAQRDGLDIAGLLIESGSKGEGWVPTQEFSSKIFEAGCHGIKFPSTKRAGGENVVIYKQHYDLQDRLFQECDPALPPKGGS